MADEQPDLPRGFHIATGKPEPVLDEHGKQVKDPETGEVLRVAHDKGVIVGPHAAVEEHTFTCPVCGNSFVRAADSAVCNGENIKVDNDSENKRVYVHDLLVDGRAVRSVRRVGGAVVEIRGHRGVDMEVS